MTGSSRSASRRREARPAGGYVLNVYKEISWTSHHAVDRVRRILGVRRVGHAGTLDPLANGVLLLGVGRATKVLAYLMDLGKVYRGTIRLGVRTASGDMGGLTLEERPVPPLDPERVREAAAAFLGRQAQVPPMVSAVKQGGQRLYRLARRGVEVERKPRTVEIRRFDILDVAVPRIDFEVECSKGTYVRTLAEDLGAALGTVATVECLTRTAIGSFSIDDSLRIISRPGSTREGLLEAALPMSRALAHLPSAQVAGSWVARVRQGGLPPVSQLRFDPVPASEPPVLPLRLVGPEGELLAIARWEDLPGPADRPVEIARTLRLERVL